MFVDDFDCTTAKDIMKRNYVKLTKLPINSILGQLYGKGVITLKQKLTMEAESLESNRMEYFLDHVILPSLDTDVSIKYKGFLEVMEKSDDAILTSMAKKLGMYINYKDNYIE